MTSKRWILVGVVAAVIVVAMLSMCGSAVQVEIATVGRDTLRVLVEEEGITRVRNRFVVAAPVTGELQRIDLEEGTAITAGEVVARIASAPEDPRTRRVTRAQLEAAVARRSQVAAEVEQAEARAVQAQREAERRRDLADAGALSREEMEQARLQASTAERQAEATRAALRAAEADVEAMRASLTGATAAATGPLVEVTAPADGRVLRVQEKSERVVTAGTPLLEIGDADGLELVVDVLSADAVRISPGDPVLVQEWGGDRPLHGRVRMIEPAAFTEVSALGVEEQRVNVIVDVIAAPPELGAGFRVEASIVVWQGVGVLTVPTSALFQRDGEWRVFVVDEGRAQLRSIDVGRRSTEAAQVREGLEDGEKVIVFPSAEVEDGARVEAG